MDEQKGRWITTKKNHRRVFIPEGKDVGEVLKEKFAKYNDDDYDFYEDGDEEEYKTYDADYDEEFYTKEELRDKFGTDDLDIINAGNEKTITLKEEDKPYDFDKYEKESGNKKENHVGYIDTSKTYDADEIFDIIVQDNENWDIQGTIDHGAKVLMAHKSGPTYTYDKNTGKVELTTRELENKKGQEAHTKELTDYIKDQISKGKKDAEQIYQDSPYSIHSHDEMVNIANDFLNNKDFESDVKNSGINFDKENEEDIFYEEQPDGTIKESWSGNAYIDKKDLEENAGSGALNHVSKKEEQENKLKKEPNPNDYRTEKDYMKAWKDWNNSRTISVYNKKGDKASFWINDDGTISNGMLNFKSKKELMDYVSKYGWSEK